MSSGDVNVLLACAAFAAGVGCVAFGVRPHGFNRYPIFLLRLLAGTLALGPLTDWPPYEGYSATRGEPHHALVIQLSTVLGAVVGRRRRHALPPRPKTPLP